jgi:hypothetical protein
MAAEGCRPANLDRAHDAAFAQAEMRAMGLTISGSVAAENIRHLKLGQHGVRF